MDRPSPPSRRSRPAPFAGRPWRGNWSWVVALVAAVLFLPSLAGGFPYDSRMQIVTDPFLHDPGNWFDVLSWRVVARDVLDNNRPVQLASLMLDAAIWGRVPLGYHLTNLVIHALNALLVWHVVERLLAQSPGTPSSQSNAEVAPPVPPASAGPPGNAASPATAARPVLAAGAGLLFTVHPLMVEAVAEPSFREDLLAAFFTLLATWLAGGLPAVSGTAAPAWGRAVAVIGASLVAVGSKESGIAAAVLVAIWWWLFQRRWRADWALTTVGSLVVTAAFLAARFLLAPESEIFSSPPPAIAGSLADTIAIQTRILALYVRLTVVPWPLCAEYGPWSLQSLPLIVAGPLLVAALVGGTAWGWRDRRAAFGMALVAAPLLPVSNIIPIYKPVADRYMYLPMAGVAALVALALEAAWRRISAPARRRAVAIAVVILATLAIGNVWRQQVWHSSLSLWQATVRTSPQSPLAALGLAEALLETGRPVEAREAALASIRLSGETWADPWLALALTLDRLGAEEAAQDALGRALALDPRFREPERCVARLAMHRPQARALADLLGRRRNRVPPATTGPGASTAMPAPVASPGSSPPAPAITSE